MAWGDWAVESVTIMFCYSNHGIDFIEYLAAWNVL
jgi:hypothetical protein